MPSYFALGTEHNIELSPLGALADGLESLSAAPFAPAKAFAKSIPSVVDALMTSPSFSSRMAGPDQLQLVRGAVAARASRGARSAGQSPTSSTGVMTIATPTVIAEGLRLADFKAAKDFGARVIEEGFDGKVLLRVDTVARAFDLARLLLARDVGSASPNFIRRAAKMPMSAPGTNWSLAKINAMTAWQTTKGSADVRVAVLDEGVDTSHPSLRAAVVAERDFIGNKGNSAMPDGNDAHGTACAGIIVSRSKTFPGIAPRCSLIAARIAMDDGHGGWVWDDFRTADAIDWCWRSGAAVLSNSWGGGAPSDPISRAFGRARTQGRNGSGAVVVIAAGNSQTLIDFPGDLPGYVTVGASTPADERKTRSSSDGESWWGSNYGPSLHLMAPGVFIWTTDISGPAGYAPGNTTKTFNGTSSATPAVAAVAALMIAANPALSATSVRNLLAKTAKKIQGQKDWTPELGWGRLDAAAAVAAAKAQATPVPVKTAAKTPAKAAVKTAAKAAARKTSAKPAASRLPRR